jgi:hypothetical protein
MQLVLTQGPRHGQAACNQLGASMTDFHTPGAQPPGAPQPSAKRGLHGCVWAIIVVVGLIILLAVISALVGGGTKSGNVSAPAASGTATAASTDADAGSSWSYSSDKDEVRNATNQYASLTSDNKVDFDFPYNGGSTLAMTIRHDHRGDNVILEISKGQFVCGLDGCSGEMNVDGSARHLTLDGAADGSANTLFARGEPGIIKALKSGKKIIIELPFYQSGNRQFTFTTKQGLVWPPAKADQAAK